MTTTRVFGAELVGVQGKLVPILIFTPENGPETQITGLSENAAKELRIRLRSVLHCLEIDPGQRIGISVPAPTTEGSAHGLDLPILIGVLAHLGKIPNPTTSVGPALEQVVSFGGLGLSGNIQPVRGAFARIHNVPLGPAIKALWIIPRGNAREAWSEVPTGARFLDVASVQDLVTALRREVSETGEHGFAFPPPPPMATEDIDLAGPSAYISPKTLRVLEIAAASRAGLLLGGRLAILCARFVNRLLPNLSVPELVEVTAIHSAAMGVEAGAVPSRPFRAPHHSVSDLGLAGTVSARATRPGEVSLAHRGVLLLDQIDEFRRPALDMAFQAMRDGEVRGYQVDAKLPAQPALVVGTLEHESASGHARPSAIHRIRRWQHHFPLYHVPVPGSCTVAEVAAARVRIADVWRRHADRGPNPSPLTLVDTIAMLDPSPGQPLSVYEEEARAILSERPEALAVPLEDT